MLSDVAIAVLNAMASHYISSRLLKLTEWPAILQDALSRQARPTAESQGIVHVEPYADEEADLDTLDLRLEYAQAVLTQV